MVTRGRQLIAMHDAERNQLARSPTPIRRSTGIIIGPLAKEPNRNRNDVAAHVQAHFSDLSALRNSVNEAEKTTIAALLCKAPNQADYLRPGHAE